MPITNEHMCKRRIGPEKLKLVVDKPVKESLITALKQKGLIQNYNGIDIVKVGKEWKPVDEVILEKTDKLTAGMFNRTVTNEE